MTGRKMINTPEKMAGNAWPLDLAAVAAPMSELIKKSGTTRISYMIP
jgi:hypothetical protein